MRFMRELLRPTPLERTARRMANMEKAVRRERDDIPLFPEMVRFSSASDRFAHFDRANMEYVQRLRDGDARTWRKFRRRLYSLSPEERRRFLEYWNAGMAPATAANASDALVAFFRRMDWRIEDWESTAPGLSEIFLKGATWAK